MLNARFASFSTQVPVDQKFETYFTDLASLAKDRKQTDETEDAYRNHLEAFEGLVFETASEPEFV